MKKKIVYLLVIIILLAPAVYLLIAWPQLPPTVPVHFGLDGKPDDWGNRTELITTIAIISAINLGTFLLLLNLHKIGSKKPANAKPLMRKIAFALAVFISLLQIMTVASALSSAIPFDKFLLPLLGLLFAFLGNLFYSVKPNYFVGIRTPWALEDEQNWRKTHQLAGKLWFGAGLLSALLSIILPAHVAIIIFIGITFIICIIPAVYSYRLFKHPKRYN